MQKATAHLLKDFSLFCVSIILAIFAVKFGWADQIVMAFPHWKLLTTFIAGSFFTSVFTTAPAIVILGDLSLHQPILTTAALGAVGSVIGDYIIFYFIRDHVAEDLHFLYRKLQHDHVNLHFPSFFRKQIFRWIMPLIGALVIASPLPDELGLTILGLSKVKTSTMLVITYSLNFIGILLIGVVARHTIF